MSIQIMEPASVQLILVAIPVLHCCERYFLAATGSKHR